MGYSVIKPYPTYIVPLQGYETTFSDFKNKVKGEYPYQVINPHYMGRQHSTMNQVSWLREAFQNPVYISSQDAKEKGFVDGDTILLTSAYGKTIRRACVTERLIPGTLGLPHGAWLDIDPETGIDRGGHDNTLTSSAAVGQAVDAYNSSLVNMEKYTGKPLPRHEHEPIKTIF
jgi:anaerobic dimethyl sulfoxide reductase subunit A